ncbi:MAG TPA: TIGR03118 family protein, partial [Tepidisphaeraceae bacterium]|nr:TIGR03118 family protein [Tepidisphaeraceae bacterium]
MCRSFFTGPTASCAGRPARQSARRPLLEPLEPRQLLSGTAGFVEHNLVSDIPGLAAHTDSVVVNPWGFTETPGGQFLLSDNGSGTGALFAADGTPLGAPIVIPPPSGSPAGTTSTPNGQLTNDTADFVITANGHSAPANLLFSTEDGTIAGFNPAVDPFNAVIGADQSASGAVYKLLAMGSAGGANYLYATNFHNGTVDVFDKNFALHTFSAGQFTDPNVPAGFAPFGVKNVNGTLFVSYARQD